MNRILLPLLLILTTSAFTQESTILKILERNKIAVDDFGLVYQKGDYRIAIHGDQAFAPASTMKIFPTAMALEHFGPGKFFYTHMKYSGEIVDSVLKGDIHIVGGGDVSLGSRHFRKKEFLSEWIRDIQAMGIKRVEGSVIGDASYFHYDFEPDSWDESDVGNYFGAGSAGLNVYDNLFEIYFKTSKAGTLAEVDSIWPRVDYLKIFGEVQAAKSEKDNCYIYGGAYVMQRKLTGSIPENRSSFLVKGSLPDPAFHLAQELEMELARKGIAFTQSASTTRMAELTGLWGEKPDLKHIKAYRGETVMDIAFHTNMKSVNLFAENLLQHLAREKGATNYPSMRMYLRSRLMRYGLTDSMVVLDGSGLSRGNRISPTLMVNFLSAQVGEGHFEAFKRSLPLAGTSGSLKNMFKGSSASGVLRAKSGSYQGVRAYAGYIPDSDGNIASFMVVINGDYSGSQMKKAMEEVMIELVEF